jgi:dipeptidyl aminopeptidase/acylaminoacyl peptidase
MNEVKINNQGSLLAGNIFLPPKNDFDKKSAVLLIHGWQSAQDRMFDLAELLSRELNMVCLTFDLSGHGQSAGEIGAHSRSDFLDDAIAAYDFLLNQTGVDPSRIGVLGTSFGGYLSALLTAKRKINWLAMRVPADYPNEGFADKKTPSDRPKITEWRSQKKSWEETAALEAVHNFLGKILIVESENDDLVPHQTIQNYVDAVVEKKNVQYELMSGAPHSLTRYPEFKNIFNHIVLNWLKKI